MTLRERDISFGQADTSEDGRVVRSMDEADVQAEIDSSLPQVNEDEANTPSVYARDIFTGDVFVRRHEVPVVRRGEIQEVIEEREVRITGIIDEGRGGTVFAPHSTEKHGEAADLRKAAFTPVQARERIIEEGHNLDDPDMVNDFENARKEGASIVLTRKLKTNQ